MSRTKENINPIVHLNDYQMSLAAQAMLDDEYDKLPEEISQHISACEKCKSDLLTLVEVLEQTPVQKDLVINPIQKEKNSSRWAWAAAASIIALVISSMAFIQKNNQYKEELVSLRQSIKESDNTTASDSTLIRLKKNQSKLKKTVGQYSDSLTELSDQLKNKSELLATSYSLYVSFEKQMKMNLRSSSIQVLSSNNIVKKYGEFVMLKWESEESPSIAIYNNKGLLILKKSDLTSSFNFDSNKVSPGIYYWKLIGAEGVTFIGKIELN